jgi:deoxyribonuclease-4
VSGYDVTDRKALNALLRDLDREIGLDRLRALHVNDAKAPLGSNRDRHDNIGEGMIGEKLGVFLGHPKLQRLPALLEVPGRDGHGPDADEVRKTKEMHARWAPKRRARR